MQYIYSNNAKYDNMKSNVLCKGKSSEKKIKN